MESKPHLEQRRQEIVEAMLRIGSMRRGTLNEQFLPVPHKGSKQPVLRGPYYVISRSEQGKTVSERVPAGKVERVRQDIAAYNRFMELSREFVELTERLGALEQAEETLKKTLKSRPGRTRR